MIHKKKKSLLDHVIDSTPSHGAHSHHKNIHAHTTPVHNHKAVSHKKIHTTSASHMGHAIHRPRQAFGLKLFSDTQKKETHSFQSVALNLQTDTPKEAKIIETKVTPPADEELKTQDHGLNIASIGRARSTITTLEDAHREIQELPVKVLKPQSVVHLRVVESPEDQEKTEGFVSDAVQSVVEIDTLSIPTAQKFHLGFGRMLSNLRELLEYLKEIGDEEWLRFVTPEENYFALWVEGIFGEKELASKLRGSNRIQSIEILESYLKGN
jgi:hypothetical protein